MTYLPPYVLVLEGADGAGKTTYAERKLENFANAGYDTVYIHNGPDDAKLPGSLFKHYRAQIADALDRPGTITVIDRSFLSEYVYGGIYRGRARISLRQVRRLERWARKQGVDLIGVQAPLHVRRFRLAERGEDWDTKQAFVGATYAIHFRESNSWLTVDSKSTDY